MKIKLTCPCGSELTLNEEWAGREVPCFDCGEMLQVPHANDEALELQILEDDILEAELLEEEEEALELEAFEEDIPEVEPTEEEDIPEVEVEVELAPWSKPPLIKDEEDDESAAAVRSVRLPSAARCLALGSAGVCGLAGQKDDVQILNMQTGKKVRRYCDHDADVTSIALSLAGDVVMSGDDDGEIMYWDLLSRKRKKRLRGHENTVLAVALSPNGEYGVSGGADGTVRLWKLDSGKEIYLSDAEWGEKVTTVTCSHDNQWLLAGGARGRINVWSLKTRLRLKQFRVADQAISSVQISNDGGTITALARPPQSNVCFHPEFWRWDAKTGNALAGSQNSQQPTCIPYHVSLLHGGKRLVVVGVVPPESAAEKPRTCLEVWGLAAAKCQYTIPDLHGRVQCLAVAPDNAHLLAALDNRRLQAFALPAR